MGKGIVVPIDNPEKVVKASNCKMSNGGNVEDALNYSTSEHIIGKWTDGSVLYEKTVDCGALPNSTTKIVQTDISNLNFFVSLNGIAIRNDKAVTYDMSSLANARWYIATTGVNIVTTSDLSDYNGYVTMRYTKTS